MARKLDSFANEDRLQELQGRAVRVRQRTQIPSHSPVFQVRRSIQPLAGTGRGLQCSFRQASL